MTRFTLLAALLAAPAARAASPAPAASPVAVSSTFVAVDATRISLTGDPFTASPFTAEHLGIVPFGRWVNGIVLQSVQHGFSFSANLEQCSIAGCVVTNEDATRVLIAREGIADAIRIPLYDDGWQRNGTAAISEEGRVAIPVAGPGNRREIWVLKPHQGSYRMDKRIPHGILEPPVARWRDEDLFLLVKGGTGYEARRVNLDSGRVNPAGLIDPWCWRCIGGGGDHWAAGFGGESADTLAGLQAVPLYTRSGDTAWLEINSAARPMTSGGLSSPVRIVVDCLGRFCVVSGMGEETWCLRFSPEGALTHASKLSGNVAGDAKSVQVDERGRFYYLETEMSEDGMSPARMHLVRLR